MIVPNSRAYVHAIPLVKLNQDTRECLDQNRFLVAPGRQQLVFPMLDRRRADEQAAWWFSRDRSQ